MVLVLAADMVRGVLHASCVRSARPQWTIQVYTPPRAWPSSTWALLAVIWHLALEDAPTGTAEEIAQNLHAWPTDQAFPRRRPPGGLPVAPAAEEFSLAATLQRHPDKRAHHFLQTGTVLAAPPDSEWRWDAGGAQLLPNPWVPPAVVLTHGYPGPCRPSRRGDTPAAAPTRRDPAPQPAGGSRLGTVEGERRAPEPVFPPGQALLHAEGVGGNRTRHGVQVDKSDRPATHAVATGVPAPPTDGSFLGAPQRPHKEGWRAMLSHHRQWMTELGARCPPGPMLQNLTAPTP